MHICFRCTKPIDASICLHQKNYYHADCCRICTPIPVSVAPPKVAPKEKTPPPAPKPAPPPPPPKVEIADPKKTRATPGRLSFTQIGSFEASKEVNCKDCKKKIVGQRFLGHKLGEYFCQACNSLREDKCSKCKTAFDTEECFKDDEGNKVCMKCIKVYQEEKKQKARQAASAAAAQAAAAAKPPPPPPAPPAPVAVPRKQKNTIHCDHCTKALTTEILEFEGGNFHFDCLVCYKCNKKLKGQKIYQEEKGLACDNCKETLKCKRPFFPT